MGGLHVPSSGLRLVGWPTGEASGKSKGNATSQRTAALLRVNKSVIRDLQDCANNHASLRLSGGRVPKLLYNDKSIEVRVEREQFTRELYTHQSSSDHLTFAATITQRAHISVAPVTQHDTSTTDAALASLKQSLASYKQDKESKQATISSSVIPNNKANKILSNRYVPNTSRPSSQISSPHISSSEFGLVPTSNPSVDPSVAARTKAMTRALIHLLASHPLADTTIHSLTHIPNPKRHELLNKVAEQQTDKTWKLKDRIYKDIDIWKFPYPSDESRDEAIESAIRAYDRLRLGKDDKLWQLLLPDHERNKGKCLSRLHGANLAPAHARRSPDRAASPMPTSDNEHPSNNGRHTPLPNSNGTARSTAAPGKAISIEKRLKESQKHRVAEEAKQARLKDKEAKSADAPPNTTMKTSKAATTGTKRASTQYKSSEIVHSSDDESDGEVKEPANKAQKLHQTSRPHTTGSPGGTSSSDGKPLMKISAAARDARKAAAPKPAASPVLSAKREHLNTVVSTARKTPVPSPDPSKTKADASRTTPSGRPEKHSHAAVKSQSTPSRLAEKPKPTASPQVKSSATPSLFGNHERSTNLVKKTTTLAPAQKSTQAVQARASTPSSEPNKKRSAPDVPADSGRPRKFSKTDNLPAAKKSVCGKEREGDSDANLKRKANNISSGIHEHDLAYDNKHRRKESSSTQSATFSSSSNTSQTTTARTSVASPSPPLHSGRRGGSNARTADDSGAWRRSPSNASSSGRDSARAHSWEQALDEAEHFRKLYPKYLDLHKKLAGMKADDVSREETARLWELHTKLERMKRDIQEAAR